MNQKYQIQLRGLVDLLSDNHMEFVTYMARTNDYLSRDTYATNKIAHRRLLKSIDDLVAHSDRLRRTAAEIESIASKLEL